MQAKSDHSPGLPDHVRTDVDVGTIACGVLGSLPQLHTDGILLKMSRV